MSEDMAMKVEPTAEHRWLTRLVGEWSYESECVMGPDQPTVKSKGVEHVRALGDLWVAGESEVSMPGGCDGVLIITLGYDPAKERFVGTFVGSMMTHLWIYDGQLDPEGRILTLDAEGPAMGHEGLTRYQDSVEMASPDHRILRSRMLGPDGEWHDFMTAHYHRRKPVKEGESS